jgi:hypothetical protein
VSAIFLKEDVMHWSYEGIIALVKTACNAKIAEIKASGGKYLLATYAVEEYNT